MKPKHKNILLFVITFVVTLLLLRSDVKIPHINPLNLFMMFAFSYPMVFVHEIGHVLAARTVGIGISRVQFGKGREIFRKRFLGILWIFKGAPGSGFTFVGELKNGFSKASYAFFGAGGLLIQSIITIIAILFSRFQFNDFFGNHKVDVIASFIMSNLFMVTMTLIPMKIGFRGFSIPNDGLNLIKLPFAKEKDINPILSAARLMEAFELYEKKSYHEAQVVFEKCIAAFPDSLVAKMDHATSILKQGKINDVEKLLLAIYQEPHDKRYDIILLNNIAWINLLKFTTKSLEIAQSFSDKAFKINPNVSFIRNTRASTLIACGKLDEGINIIRGDIKTGKPVDNETNNIVGFMMLGFAFLMKREEKKAQKYLLKFKENICNLDQDDMILFDKLKENSEEFKKVFCTDGEGCPSQKQPVTV